MNRLWTIILSRPRWEIFKKEWYYISPLLIITILMLLGYSAGFAAVVGIVTCIVVSWFKKDTRMDIGKFVQASRAGTEQSGRLWLRIRVYRRLLLTKVKCSALFSIATVLFFMRLSKQAQSRSILDDASRE